MLGSDQLSLASFQAQGSPWVFSSPQHDLKQPTEVTIRQIDFELVKAAEVPTNSYRLFIRSGVELWGGIIVIMAISITKNSKTLAINATQKFLFASCVISAFM